MPIPFRAADRRRLSLACVAALLAAVGLVAPAAKAQDAAAEVPAETAPPADPLTRALTPPGAIDPAFAVPGDPLPAAAAPFAPSDLPDLTLPSALPSLNVEPEKPARSELILNALLLEGGNPLQSGVVWRIYDAKAGPDGTLPLVATGVGGVSTFTLDPGVYMVYCGFGHAGTTVRVEVGSGIREERVVLNAGGLVMNAEAEEKMLPSEDVHFDVYSLDIDERGERKIVARNVPAGTIARLSASTYHIVSRYGGVNAVTSADVEVKAGKLTEVTLDQRAAEVTLKLVSTPGGEAIADTRWSVLTPGGDIVTEGVGAFPSFVLASGEYTVIAKHADKVFQRRFDVESGRDVDVEVLALDWSPAEGPGAGEPTRRGRPSAETKGRGREAGPPAASPPPHPPPIFRPVRLRTARSSFMPLTSSMRRVERACPGPRPAERIAG